MLFEYVGADLGRFLYGNIYADAGDIRLHIRSAANRGSKFAECFLSYFRCRDMMNCLDIKTYRLVMVLYVRGSQMTT